MKLIGYNTVRSGIRSLHSRIPLQTVLQLIFKLEMWANAQRDGRPAEHRWRPLFNAAKFG